MSQLIKEYEYKGKLFVIEITLNNDPNGKHTVSVIGKNFDYGSETEITSFGLYNVIAREKERTEDYIKRLDTRRDEIKFLEELGFEEVQRN